MSQRIIYCDHNSTTRTDPRVADVMHQAAVEVFGNPSSGHRFGQQARALLDKSRSQIAAYIGAKPSEIILTGTGSESDNLAIFGSLYAPDATGRHLLTVATEHHAITHSADWAQRHGFEVTILPVDSRGHVDPDDFARALTPTTRLASVMLANNEVGTIHPIAQLATIARERGVLFHTDAVQAMGKIPVNVDDLKVDLLSLAAPQEAARVGAMAKDLRYRLAHQLDDIEFFGDPDNCLPNTVGVGFGGVDGESLAIALDLKCICVSTGSACMTGAAMPSHVLQAMGVSERYLRGSIRFSFGRENVPTDSAAIADTVIAEVQRLRKMSPVRV
ncbi:MAG: cysteine desulfurase [candidate division Zixibacteria bacterium]|nr:cysteine desulfurase [candidate division Zixibacteria bacterium]